MHYFLLNCARKENIHGSANHKEKYSTKSPIFFDLNKISIAVF